MDGIGGGGGGGDERIIEEDRFVAPGQHIVCLDRRMIVGGSACFYFKLQRISDIMTIGL